MNEHVYENKQMNHLLKKKKTHELQSENMASVVVNQF